MIKTSFEKFKDMLCENIVLKALSVLLAVILWLLVINIDDPQTTATIKNIKVTVINDEVITGNDEVYDILSGEMINVKITGPRTIVDSLTEEDFTATADFSELSKTNAVPIDVFVNNTRYETKIQIIGQSENVMKLSIEEVTEHEYDVLVEYSSNPAENYIVYKTTPSVSKINVRAPKSVHERISKVSSIISLKGDETTDFEVAGTLYAYDKDNKLINAEGNHITFEETTITVSGIVYYKKTVDVIYEIVNNLSGNRFLVDYAVNFNVVDIVGRKETVDMVEEIIIPSEQCVITDQQTSFEVDIKTLLPEGVYIYGSDGVLKVSASVEDTVRKAFMVGSEDIGIKKIPEGYEASLPEMVEVLFNFKGERELIEKLEVDDISVYVELNECVEGDNTVSVQATVPDGVELTNDPKITVTLTKKKNEETNQTTEATTKEEVTEQETTTPEETVSTETTQADIDNAVNPEERQ